MDLADLDPSADELAFSPDGSMLATADGPMVRWWNVRTGEVVRTLRLRAGVEVLGFSPDRKVLADTPMRRLATWAWADAASGDITGAFQIWEAAGSEDHRLALAFSPDGGNMVTSVHTSGALSGQAHPRVEHPERCLGEGLPGGAPHFSPDGEILAP